MLLENTGAHGAALKGGDMEIKFKPCPFCGGSVKLDARKGYEERQEYYGKACLLIECMDCGAQVTAYNYTDGPLPYETMAEAAAEKWNRRV
mgnify:CR=1 FL=1